MIDSTLVDLGSKIGRATSAAEVVGPDDDERNKRLTRIRLILHPDKWSNESDIKAAQLAFARLEELLDKEKLKTSNKFDITTKLRTYNVDGIAFSGKVANLYHCSYVRDGNAKSGLMKMPKSPIDNDLIAQEAKVLKSIFKEPHKRSAFYPRLEDSFKHKDASTGIERQTNILRRLDGFVSLDEVKRIFCEAYGEEYRFDLRDLAWMWRRVYVGISLAHELGYVHGSISPEHILIHPELHGLQIVGWGQSVETGDTVKLLGSAALFSAPEILKKERVSSATDIFSISQVFRWLMTKDSNQPGVKQFNSFIKGTTYDSRTVRPQNSLELLGEFDQLLERTFGPRKFRPFVLPSN